MTRLTGLLIVASLLAAACGGGEEPATPTSPPSSTTPSSTTQAAPDSTPTTTAAPTTTAGPIDSEALEAARSQLRGQVPDATAPWPTDWTMSSIDLGELLLGIPRLDPRDSIPPIDDPQYESVDDAAAWLEAEEPGALVRIEGEARFFPLSILHRHEIVNDEWAGVPVAVTYCPLCNTAIAFDRRVDGVTLRLGVSGLLRNSDLVMWDDQTVSLWQQVTGEAIVGAATGQRLTPVSTSIVSFGDFAATFPDGLSLSRDTGFGISYGANPYVGYSSSEIPFLFDGDIDPRYPALSRVVGVTVGDSAKAYPFSEIEPIGTVNDVVGGEPIAVFWGGGTRDALDSGLVSSGQAIGTGVAYLSTVDGQVLTFAKEPAGASDVWVDAETGSTWTLLGEAIAGPLEGSQLQTAVHRNEFWFAWAAFFAGGEVFDG